MDEEEVNKLNDLNKNIIEQENEVRLDGDEVLPDVADSNTVIEEVTECMRTPKGTTGETARDYKVIRIIEDGSVVCSCRNFLRYGFLCRHIFCVFKNREINVIPKQYILRRWTRDIIPPGLRRQRNRYGEKNLTIERLTNEANFLVDDCLFMLSNNEEKMGTYVENLKKLSDDVKANMPNPPSRNTGDVIGGIFSITTPNQIAVQNPTKAVNKGEHLKKGERLKSELRNLM
ncbi:FAR1 DNA binding domain, zinc finger, SWIM-type, MULE transposase domain containing protein [Tanacetum coccineum]